MHVSLAARVCNAPLEPHTDWFVQHFCAAVTCNYAKQRVLLRDVTRVRVAPGGGCGVLSVRHTTDAQDATIHVGGCGCALSDAPAGGLPVSVDTCGSTAVRGLLWRGGFTLCNRV